MWWSLRLSLICRRDLVINLGFLAIRKVIPCNLGWYLTLPLPLLIFKTNSFIASARRLGFFSRINADCGFILLEAGSTDGSIVDLILISARTSGGVVGEARNE